MRGRALTQKKRRGTLCQAMRRDICQSSSTEGSGILRSVTRKAISCVPYTSSSSTVAAPSSTPSRPQFLVDLYKADPLAADLPHVIQSPEDGDDPVRVDPRRVTRVNPALAQAVSGRRRFPKIAQHDNWSADAQLVIGPQPQRHSRYGQAGYVAEEPGC